MIYITLLLFRFSLMFFSTVFSKKDPAQFYYSFIGRWVPYVSVAMVILSFFSNFIFNYLLLLYRNRIDCLLIMNLATLQNISIIFNDSYIFMLFWSILRSNDICKPLGFWNNCFHCYCTNWDVHVDYKWW